MCKISCFGIASSLVLKLNIYTMSMLSFHIKNKQSRFFFTYLIFRFQFVVFFFLVFSHSIFISPFSQIVVAGIFVLFSCYFICHIKHFSSLFIYFFFHRSSYILHLCRSRIIFSSFFFSHLRSWALQKFSVILTVKPKSKIQNWPSIPIHSKERKKK